jgi:hypothetical protein
MNRESGALVAIVLGMTIYLAVCLPLAKWVARRLTGRSFRWQLRPDDHRSRDDWRDVAWSSVALIAAIAVMAALMDWLGWGP